MAIANLDTNECGTGFPTEKKSAVSIKKVINTRTVVDVDTAIIKTIKYIDGADWPVDYYHLLTAMGDVVNNIDEYAIDAESSYEKISELILKVTNPIEVDNIKNITGVALISHFQPSKGDSFVAELLDGRKAIFIVTDVTSKAYNIDRVYEIAFSLFSLVNDNVTKYEALERRVVRTFIEDYNSLYTESSRLLLEDTYVFKDHVIKEINNLNKLYRRLFKTDRKILVFNDIFDPFINHLYYYVSDNQDDLFIMSNDSDIEKTIINNIIVSDPEFRFLEQPSIKNIKQTYDMDRRTKALVSTDAKSIFSLGLNQPYYINTLNKILPKFTKGNNAYLFTLSFYNKEFDKLSLLEKLVLKLVNREVIIIDDIKVLLTETNKLNREELYFYLPIILMLLRYYLTGIYDERLRNV